MNSVLHNSCINGSILGIKNVVNHCTKNLTDTQTLEFLLLENKKGKTASQIAFEKLEE